jgi:FKBP-type peptidyl-prolyl cis-trans isomerase
MKKYFLILLVAAFTIQANAQGEFKRTEKGTQYQMLSHNTGDKIKLNDVITFEVVQKTEKDSILFSTYKTGAPAQAQVQPTGDLMDIFPLMCLNDSVLVKVPTDSIFKAQEDHRPPFLPKGSNLLFVLKIDKVQSLAEAMAERDRQIAEGKALMDKYQADETVNANKYIAEKKLLLKTTASGLKYKTTKLSVKRKPIAGDTVVVNYTGRSLDGKVFDTSVAAEGEKANLERPAEAYKPFEVVIGRGNVIPGWDEGLLLMGEGAKATFIIPSKLAYGEKGAGDDIKPFSTLIFDIELIKIRPDKKAHAAAAKKGIAKPGAKKAPAKKTSATAKKKS